MIQGMRHYSDIIDIDRKKDYEWIRENALSYRGQWVALDRGQLLVADKSLGVLLERIKKIELEYRPLLHRID